MATFITSRSSNFTFKNLLQELNLNPEWEKWQGYFFAASVICCLFPFYMTIGGLSFQCIPDTSGINATIEGLSIPEAAYVNERCAVSNNLFVIRFWGALMLLTCVALLLASTFWLHVRSVKEGLKTFSEACNKLTELVLSMNEMKNHCLQPMPGKNEEARISTAHKSLREVCVLLVLHNPQKAIFRIYLGRCVVVILMCFQYFIFYVFLQNCSLLGQCNIVYHDHNTLYCQLEHYLAIKRFHGYYCMIGQTRFIIWFASAFMVMLIFQVVCLIAGQVRVAKPPVSDRSLRLMIAFWDSASPTKLGILKNLLFFLFSEQYGRRFHNKCEDICRSGDIELIRIGTKILGRIPQVIEFLCAEFGSDIRMMPLHAFPRDKYKSYLEAAKYSINDRRTVSLAAKLMEFKQWEVLVCLLENSSLKDGEEAGDDISTLRVNSLEVLDSNLSTSVLSARYSILYYAFLSENDSGPVRFAAARFLCYGKQLSDLYVITKIGGETNRKLLAAYLMETYKTKVWTKAGFNKPTLFSILVNFLRSGTSNHGSHSYTNVDVADETEECYSAELDLEMGREISRTSSRQSHEDCNTRA